MEALIRAKALAKLHDYSPDDLKRTFLEVFWSAQTKIEAILEFAPLYILKDIAEGE